MTDKKEEKVRHLEWDKATQDKAIAAYTFIRRQLITKSPFYAVLSMRLQPRIATPLQVITGCWCAATNGKHFIINPDGWLGLTPKQQMWVMKHEILHCVLRHPTRISTRHPPLWNIACDFVVNMVLTKSKEDLPVEGALWDDRFQKMDADSIYQILKNELMQQRQSGGSGNGGGSQGQGESDDSGGQGQGQQGSPDENQEGMSQPNKQQSGRGQGHSQSRGQSQGGGQPDQNQSGGSGQAQQNQNDQGDQDENQSNGKRDKQREAEEFRELAERLGANPHSTMMDPFDDPETGDKLNPEDMEHAKAQIENAWKAAFAQARQVASGKGDYPAGLEQLVERENAPRLPWERLLQQWVQARIREGYDWMRPNRRFVAEGIYLPGRGKPSLGDVVVLVDTSGSVGDKLLAAFLGEIEGVLKAHPARVFLVACDASPWLVGEYDNAYDFPMSVPIKGRGGTDFRPGVKWIEEHSGPFCEGEQHMDEIPRIAIYLTDGMGNYPEELPEGLDMLWVLSRNWEKGSAWYPTVGEAIIAFEDLD